jgi:hypothetical protein
MKNNDAIWTSPEMLKNPKSVAFDEALGKLQEVGVADAFLSAVKNNPEFLKALQSSIPEFGMKPIAGDWSCCITNKKTSFEDALQYVIQPRDDMSTLKPESTQLKDNINKTIK